jgi:hypothetical protein
VLEDKKGVFWVFQESRERGQRLRQGRGLESSHQRVYRGQCYLQKQLQLPFDVEGERILDGGAPHLRRCFWYRPRVRKLGCDRDVARMQSHAGFFDVMSDGLLDESVLLTPLQRSPPALSCLQLPCLALPDGIDRTHKTRFGRVEYVQL